jgi:hypothetical protein
MMKILIAIICIGALLTSRPAKAQQQPTDSIILKQLLRQKKQWQLSDAQFESYQKLVKRHHEKMSQLTTSTKDTTAFTKGADELMQKHLTELKKIFTAEQMDAYMKAIQTNWARFEKYTKDNHIQTFGKPTTTN